METRVRNLAAYRRSIADLRSKEARERCDHRAEIKTRGKGRAHLDREGIGRASSHLGARGVFLPQPRTNLSRPITHSLAVLTAPRNLLQEYRQSSAQTADRGTSRNQSSPPRLLPRGRSPVHDKPIQREGWGSRAGPSGSRGSIRCPCDRRPFGLYRRKCKSIVRSRGRKWPFTPENPPVLHTGWNPAPRCPLRRQAASTRSACSPRDGPERSFKAATRVRIPLGSPPMLYFPLALPGSDTGERLTPLPRCKHIAAILRPLRAKKQALRGFYCESRPGGAALGAKWGRSSSGPIS